MPRIQTYIKQSTHTKLTKLSELQGHSISNAAADMIELGLKVEEHSYHQNKQEVRQQDTLQPKHSEFLLTILAVVSDILRCVNQPEKTKHRRHNPDDEIAEIRHHVQDYIASIS